MPISVGVVGAGIFGRVWQVLRARKFGATIGAHNGGSQTRSIAIIATRFA